MTATLTREVTDTNLVAASRQGDREAFGEIVRRYQGLISGLIYSSCGDLSASEDIAQETFLSAWKSLSGLREPSKLAAWLCQIARHRMLDESRNVARTDARLARAITNHDQSQSPRPDQEAMTAEEREVLWKSLAEIPEPYRQTLILFYRQNQSTQEVAAALETSEDTIRQRLSRGRQMLRDQVAVMLERNLARSAPAPQFASMVVAALPALVAQSATAATASGLAKAGTAAKGAASLAVLAMWIGPIFGVLGGIFGTAQSIRSTQTPRERKFVVKFSVIIWIYVFVAMGVLFSVQYLSQEYHWNVKARIFTQCGFWLVYAATLVAMILRWNRLHKVLRREEGLPALSMKTSPPSPMARFIALAGATIGSLTWMLALAIPAGDKIGAAIVAVMMAGLIAWGWTIKRINPLAHVRRFYLVHATVMAIFSFIMVNWRIQLWVAGTSGLTMDQVRARVPLWGANLLLGVLWVFILALMWVTMRSMGRSAEVDAALSEK